MSEPILYDVKIERSTDDTFPFAYILLSETVEGGKDGKTFGYYCYIEESDLREHLFPPDVMAFEIQRMHQRMEEMAGGPVQRRRLTLPEGWSTYRGPDDLLRPCSRQALGDVLALLNGPEGGRV